MAIVSCRLTNGGGLTGPKTKSNSTRACRKLFCACLSPRDIAKQLGIGRASVYQVLENRV